MASAARCMASVAFRKSTSESEPEGSGVDRRLSRKDMFFSGDLEEIGAKDEEGGDTI